MNIGIYFVKLFLFIIKLFTWPVCQIISLKYGEKCPPANNPILFHSAKKLAFLIRNKQLTSEEIIRSYIARVKEVNPVLNAVVQDRFEKAIVDAQRIDQLIQSNSKTEEEIRNGTPLLGVPITIKESLACEGMSNAAGTKQLRIASVDADIVRLARQAGAIPMLVSNTPELCMAWESFNNVTGRTLNPYNTKRTSGGSSGGEAALLGSGASVIGLGSDIGGSLRLPAMFTGVYGHKPTPDTVSIMGHYPHCFHEVWPKYFATGPMTRYAEDLPLLLSVITKPELRKQMRLNEEVDLKNLKIYYSENSFPTKVSGDILAAIRKIVLQFEKQHSVKTKKVEFKQMKEGFAISVPVLLGIDQIQSPFYNEITQKFSLWPELFRYVTCRSLYSFPVILYGLVKSVGNLLFRNAGRKCVKICEEFKIEFEEMLKDNGVYLYPVFPSSAHIHNAIYFKLVNVAFMSIFNTLGLPVTSCPVGFDSQGLPIGIQIVTKSGNDRLAIAVAKEIEGIFGAWNPALNDVTNIKSIMSV